MKVTIVGAGMVGSSIAYAAMIEGIVREIALVDINSELAKGQAMDLSHGNAYVRPLRIHGGDYDVSSDSDVVVITAGRPQKGGESRLQLLKDNARTVKEAVAKSLSYSKEPVFIIVTNPVDVLTWVAWKASGLPRNRIIGSGTTLDTARLRQSIADHCQLDPRNVHAYVLGEHGDSEIVNWSHADIAGIPLTDFCRNCRRDCEADLFQKLFEETKNAAYRIIEKKGSTFYGIGLAVSKVLSTIFNNQHSVLTVSTVHPEFEGLKDVPFSVPTILGREGVERILKVGLSSEELKGLSNSAGVIANAIKSLRDEEGLA